LVSDIPAGGRKIVNLFYSVGPLLVSIVIDNSDRLVAEVMLIPLINLCSYFPILCFLNSVVDTIIVTKVIGHLPLVSMTPVTIKN
jgi:hypothetical protein